MKKKSKPSTEDNVSTESNKLGILSQDQVDAMIKAINANYSPIPYLASIKYTAQQRWSYFDSHHEAERDEQGTMYGYKVLIVNLKENSWWSPVYPHCWNEDGTLESDLEPTEDNPHGIYCLKSTDEEELYYYWRRFTNQFGARGYCRPVIVKLAVSGTVIEGEKGFRAQRARIISILGESNGWISYEEYLHGSRKWNNPYSDYPL